LGWAIKVAIFLVGGTLLLDQLEAFAFMDAFPISPNKAFTVVLLGLAAMNWIVAGGKIPGNRKSKWLIAFYFSLAVSSGHAAVQGVGFTWIMLRWTTLISMLLFYYLLLYVLRDRKTLDLFLFSMMVSGVIATASAFLLEGSGGYYGPVRRSGLGSGENQAAGNLLMLLPFVFALTHRRPSLFQKTTLVGIAVVFVVGFAVALSRSAFLAALAMGAMWGLRMRRLSDLRVVAAGLVFVVIAYLVAPEGYASRLESLVNIFQSTRTAYTDEIGYRASIYQAGFIAFVENPVIGVGLEQFVDWAGRRDASMIGVHEIHNAVLKVAANQGLLGVVPYLALLLVTFLDFSRVQVVARAYRHLQDYELDQLYVRALTAQVGFVGILVVGMFQPGTFWRGIWALFAISTVLIELTRQRLNELGVGQSAPQPELFERSDDPTRPGPAGPATFGGNSDSPLGEAPSPSRGFQT